VEQEVMVQEVVVYFKEVSNHSPEGGGKIKDICRMPDNVIQYFSDTGLER
jgi:hypothetical protein